MSDRTCAWCRSLLEQTARPEKQFCSQRCRQWAHRFRRRQATADRAAKPMHFGYADPPYPGCAKRYYGDQPTYAGEVDHAELIARLEASYPDGWALSTSARALRWILPLCPEGARVCPWVKPGGVPPERPGPRNRWEPLIVVRGRATRPGFADWLQAHAARYGGDLPGRKPLAFCAFLFRQLGALPGDTLDDLYPGTGIVGRAFAELSRIPRGDGLPFQEAFGDAFQAALGDVSTSAPSDASTSSPGDMSTEYFGDGIRPKLCRAALGDVSRPGLDDGEARHG